MSYYIYHTCFVLPQSDFLVMVSLIGEHQIVTFSFIANKAIHFWEVQKESPIAFQSPMIPAVGPPGTWSCQSWSWWLWLFPGHLDMFYTVVTSLRKENMYDCIEYRLLWQKQSGFDMIWSPYDSGRGDLAPHIVILGQV